MEKILTRYPEPGRTGRRIDKIVYDVCRRGILDALQKAGGELTHAQLFDRLERKLKGKIKGSIAWYGETVKLDLVARGIIQRSPGSPQRIRLVRRYGGGQ